METKSINEIVIYYLEKIKEWRDMVIDDEISLYDNGYINDDKRAEAALKSYLYNTNAVNLNHTQYLIMLGIAKNCWYFKRPIFNYSIRKFLNGNR